TEVSRRRGTGRFADWGLVDFDDFFEEMAVEEGLEGRFRSVGGVGGFEPIASVEDGGIGGDRGFDGGEEEVADESGFSGSGNAADHGEAADRDEDVVAFE